MQIMNLKFPPFAGARVDAHEKVARRSPAVRSINRKGNRINGCLFCSGVGQIA